MNMKVLICDPIHEDGIEQMRDFADVDIKTDLSHEELIEVIPEYDAMVVRSATKVREDVIDAADNLKLIVRAGVGLDNIDLEYADKKGVRVENTPEAPSNATAEIAIGMMFAKAREIPKADKNMKEGKWIKSELSGTELAGKTLGVIGTGRIGSKVSEKGIGLGMKVIGYDLDERKEFKELGGEYVDFDTLLKESDYISLHVPMQESTKHLIGTDEFEKMKEDATIVNAARGPVIDEEALIDALKSGEIGGACLDVHEKEPEEKEEILEMDNVVLLPHLGASTIEAQKATATLSAEKIKKILG